MIENYTDQQVVALFNGCFDFRKWYGYDHKIRSRFDKLLKCHRVALVCFSPASGFGLKVYNDSDTQADPDSDDECTPRPSFKAVDTDGAWMRCPPMVAPPIPPKLDYVVMNTRATAFMSRCRKKEELSAEDETGMESVTDYTLASDYTISWTTGVGNSSRNTAKKFSEDDAKKIAIMVGGHAVKV